MVRLVFSENGSFLAGVWLGSVTMTVIWALDILESRLRKVDRDEDNDE